MFKYIKSILPSSKNRLWFWIVMMILLSFYPYKLANAYYPFIDSSIQTIFAAAISLTVVAFLIKKKSLPSCFWICIVIMFAGSLLQYFMTGDKYYYHKLISLEAAICLIVIVYSKIGYKPFFTLYNRWILIMAILSAIAFFVIMANIPPVFEFQAMEDGRTIRSWIIAFTKGGETLINRPAGFFDEPGALGYWGCFTLAINRLYIKDYTLEKILLLALVFTMSMGYLLQAIVFLILFTAKGSSFKNKIGLLFLSAIVLFVLFSLKGTKYNDIYESSVGRIEVMISGEKLLSLKGTTREKLVEDSKEIFEKNPVWGMGWPVDDDSYIGDNQYETLAHDGIVGTIYQYFPYILLLFWGIKRNDTEIISIVIFLALAIFHRPIHPNILTYFIYYSLPLIYWLKIQEEKSRGRIA